MPQIKSVISGTVVRPFTHQAKHDEDKEKASDNLETCLMQTPFDISKPLVYSMGIFGLLFLNSRTRKWALITKVYSTMVLLLLWAKFFRFFFIYAGGDGFGPVLFFKLIFHFWYLLCAIAATVTYKSCMTQKRFVKFLLSWSQLLKTNRGCGPDDSDGCILHKAYIKQMKTRFYIYFTIGWLSILVNTTFVCYILIFTNLADFQLYPLPANHKYAFMLKCFIAVTDVYNTATWAFTLCLFFLMAQVIYKEFEIFCQDFRKAISPDGDIPCVEYFRRRHQDICQLVETADDILSAFNAAGIITQTCNGMLILYNLVWFQSFLSDKLFLVSNGFWLWSCMVYLVIIAYGGSYLNHMAHSPLKMVHDIRVKEVSSKLALQMNMFLTKLTGEPIGLTALDMFVIDKPTILTIAGAFLTYFIVLVQFQQPEQKDVSLLDCKKYFPNTTSVF